ncbi:MAG: hypothetical protein DRN18_04320 [Thermoplasmata archaeon]|nr:MAG: hypothetical protein DRN18_04320 [Thermoplasmata archaeon]
MYFFEQERESNPNRLFPPSGIYYGEIMKFEGKHLLLAYKTNFNLEDTPSIKNILREAIINSGAKIEGISEKKFSPHGYSIVILISESHASIHTFPEESSLFVDYFACGDVDIETFKDYLLKHIPAVEIFEDTTLIRPVSNKSESFKKKVSKKLKDENED